MNFEKYLIPDLPASEGFLGSLNSIPSSEIQKIIVSEVKTEIAAMETYVLAAMSYLTSDIAMESSGSDDKFSTIAAKAKSGSEKMKEGKTKNNPNLIAQGSQELTAATKELEIETKKAKDPKTKARAWTVAKIIGGITAGILLIFGAAAAGKALSSGVKSGDLASGTKNAKGSLRRDSVLAEMNKQTKELEDIQKQRAVISAKLDRQIEELDKTAQTLRQMTSARGSESKDSEPEVYRKLPDGTTKKVPYEEFEKWYDGQKGLQVRMPDGSIKFMTMDEAMKSNGTLII